MSLKRSQKPNKTDEDTLLQYEQLSYFEREEIAQWIQKNLYEIPMPSKVKKTGLQGLLSGDFSGRATLVMLRYAMSALRM